MGREAVATVHWDGRSALAKVVLESTEIIVRGDLKARVPRREIDAISVNGGRLEIMAAGRPLSIDLPAGKADKWASALRKPAPTLAEKLGVDAARRAFVTGAADDSNLAAALLDARADTVAEASCLIAVLATPADLDAAVTLAQVNAPLPLWAIYPKGRATLVGDALVRRTLRAAGYIDTKTCAVSEKLTTTRYAAAKA